MMYMDGMIGNDSPTRMKSRNAVKKTTNVVRETTRCFCSGRGTLSPQISSVAAMFVCRERGTTRRAGIHSRVHMVPEECELLAVECKLNWDALRVHGTLSQRASVDLSGACHDKQTR